jgi:putative ABC transport system permease protein
MKFPFRLVAANFTKHPIRTFLTIGSLTVALFLLCTLASLLTTIEAGVRNARSDRIITQSAVSLFVTMPESYLGKIRQVPGVTGVCGWTWFGGVYQNPENFFAQFACSHESLLSLYPEISLVEGDVKAWENDRQSCLIGIKLAEKYDFKVGQTIPIQGTIYPRSGGEAWEFKVAGIYRSSSPAVDQQTMFFHFDYLRESVEQGASEGEAAISVAVVGIEPEADPIALMGAIDAFFEGGPQKTQTTSESEFQAQFVSMMGSVPFFLGSIGTAVLFAILLAVINTMLMAAREQIRDVGILKALGFTGGTTFLVFFSQSVLLAVVGGALGVLLAKVAEPGIAVGIGSFFPGYRVLPATVYSALAAALAIGVIAGIAPSLAVLRIKVVDALRAKA